MENTIKLLEIIIKLILSNKEDTWMKNPEKQLLFQDFIDGKLTIDSKTHLGLVSPE